MAASLLINLLHRRYQHTAFNVNFLLPFSCSFDSPDLEDQGLGAVADLGLRLGSQVLVFVEPLHDFSGIVTVRWDKVPDIHANHQ